MILLDSNILLRHAKPTDPAHATARDAMAVLQVAGDVPCLVPQNLYEFWAVATRPLAVNGLGLTAAECQGTLLGFERLCLLLPDKPSLLAEWRALVIRHNCKGKVSHDARLVAAMRTHGLTRLLTFNVADFARYPGLTVLDPHEVVGASNPGTTF